MNTVKYICFVLLRLDLILVGSLDKLTHWGRVTHIYVGKLIIIGTDNGLSPGRRQAIIRTNDGILLIGPLGTNISEILIEIHIFSFGEMHLKMSSAKWRLFRPGLNVLKWSYETEAFLIKMFLLPAREIKWIDLWEDKTNGNWDTAKVINGIPKPNEIRMVMKLISARMTQLMGDSVHTLWLFRKHEYIGYYISFISLSLTLHFASVPLCVKYENIKHVAQW